MRETGSKVKVKHVKTSWRKAGLVLDLIRGNNVHSAMNKLKFLNKAVTPAISKALKSAVANVGKSVDTSNYIIKEAYVGQGPVMKRMRPGAQGRGAIYRKKTCHITIKIAEA